MQEVAQRAGTLHFFMLMLWQTDERIANSPVLGPLSEGCMSQESSERSESVLDHLLRIGWFLKRFLTSGSLL
jgi:hypothetical protein